jgi:putative RecB family exonuclease
MVYPISATKLRNYQRCPYSYYLRYEKRVSSQAFYGSSAVGSALTQALAQCHRDWHYHAATPDRRWFHQCWKQQTDGLTLQQVREGKAILDDYYDRFVQSESALRRPLDIQGKIQTNLQVGLIEFQINGRYDRLDSTPAGLELIDYKAAKTVSLLNTSDMELQLGLYAIALEKTYQQRLRYLSLILLRSGEKVQYKVNQSHSRNAKRVIQDLATQLQADQNWQPTPGEHCGDCTFSHYCTAASRNPDPLPVSASSRSLQLAFPFSA